MIKVVSEPVPSDNVFSETCSEGSVKEGGMTPCPSLVGEQETDRGGGVLCLVREVDRVQRVNGT